MMVIMSSCQRRSVLPRHVSATQEWLEAEDRRKRVDEISRLLVVGLLLLRSQLVSPAYYRRDCQRPTVHV